MSSVLARVLPQDRASRAASLSVGLNAVLMVFKLSIGFMSGSIAVLSDGVDSLEDLIAALIAFASVRYGARPPDARHPYGHGRAETLAASFQALLIAGGGGFIIVRAVMRILDPPDHIHANIGILAMLIAAGANLALVQYTGRVARETRSPALTSETRHLWTNVVQAGSVALGLAVVSLTGQLELDGLVALCLGVYLLWIAGNIFWNAAGDVLDASLDPEEVEQIKVALSAFGADVHDIHELRTRRAGQVRHIDFHVALPGEMTVASAHLVAEELEGRIEQLFPGSSVNIHIDPREEPAKDAGL